MRKKLSLRRKIIYVFLIVALLSSVILGIFSYLNIASSLKKSMEENANNTLIQVDNNINIFLDSYEDVLYQIYTNDDVIEYIDNINNDENSSVAKNSLRRYLRALVNSKEYIRSITVISANREIVAYDQMTNKTYENGWLENYSLDKEALYSEISQNALLHIFMPEYGTTFANENYYLLHLGHRLVDYKDIQRDIGVVIISIDEKLLENSCRTSAESGDYIFITDINGRIISCGDKQEYIGEEINISDEKTVKDFVYNNSSIRNYEMYVYYDEALEWNIFCIDNRENLTKALRKQLYLIILVELLVFTIISIIIFLMTDRLARSVDKVVTGMRETQTVKDNILIEIDDSMPIEIETIANGFNDMLHKLDEANESERIAMIKQREAQIAALEAQINPHFLYNTLDTINWIAIDKDEFEISSSISALASILRYAISDSSAIVSLRDEIEWLKKYVYLQQVRLKNKFICTINCQPEALEAKIHKLLLQPFIENSIVHGFEDWQDECILNIDAVVNENLVITISDNGRGMEQEIIDKCNSIEILEDENRKHIGMGNAITRLKMYYGEKAFFRIKSQIGKGTTITIQIPIEK